MNYYEYRNTNMSSGMTNHTHEFLGSTTVADAHTHRYAGISSKAISVPNGHIHEIVTNTSFDDMHIHQMKLQTGIQIPMANDGHIHYVEGRTSTDDGHYHNYKFTTLI